MGEQWAFFCGMGMMLPFALFWWWEIKRCERYRKHAERGWASADYWFEQAKAWEKEAFNNLGKKEPTP